MVHLVFTSFLFSMVGIGCSLNLGQGAKTPLSRLPIPTKDEVALIEDTPLTISQLLTIRAALRKHSTQDAYWVALSSLALQKTQAKQGIQIDLRDAALLSRYAIGDIHPNEAQSLLKSFYPHATSLPVPTEVKKNLDALISKLTIRTGLYPLSSFN